MIYFSYHENIFLFTGSTFLLMLHFRQYLHGGCLHYLFPSCMELVTIGTLAVCAFSKKVLVQKKNAPFFQCNHEHACLMCASTVLIKCIYLPWPEKKPDGRNSSEGRRYITVTVLSSVNMQCTILAQFKKFESYFNFAYFSPLILVMTACIF